MGLFDDLRNAASKREENAKRASEALDKIASPLKPERYLTGFEGEQIPYSAPRPTLTYSEAMALISPQQMERLQSRFETKLWRDYNQSGAFEGDYTQEDAQRQASEDIKNAAFHVVRDEDKFYLYMTPQHGDIYGFVSVRASIHLERVGPEVEQIVSGAIERDSAKKEIEFTGNEKDKNKNKEDISMNLNKKEYDFKEFDFIEKESSENKKSLTQEQLEVTVNALFAMQKAGTYVSLDMLKQLIPEDVYNELETTIYQKTLEEMPYTEECGLTREEYNQVIEDSVKRQNFTISMDASGNLTAVNHPWNRVEFTHPIYIDCIDCNEFLPMAKAALETHLERHQSYTEAHNLNGAEITNTLSEAINKINNVIARAESLNREGDSVLDEIDNSKEFDKNTNEFIEKNNDIFDKNINEIIPDDDDGPGSGGASGSFNIGEDR